MTRSDFSRIPELRQEINKALIMWENALESATRTTTVITGMPKGNGVTSQIETAVVKAETYKEHYDELCAEQSQIYKRLNQELKILNEQEQDVIRKVYPQGMKISEVAIAMHLTERHVYRLKNSALNKLCVA